MRNCVRVAKTLPPWWKIDKIMNSLQRLGAQSKTPHQAYRTSPSISHEGPEAGSCSRQISALLPTILAVIILRHAY